MKLFHLFTASLLVLPLFACGSDPQGRVMGTGEEDYVDAKRAGSEVYDRLIEETLTKMMARYDQRTSSSGLQKLSVAFVELENASGEPLGERFEQIYEHIDTAVNNHERFKMISRRFVNAALNEMGKPSYDKLFVPSGMRQFASILERQGAPLDLMLWAKLTSGENKGGQDNRQVNYTLTLELIDIASGEAQKDSCQVRKAYTK